MITSNLGNNYSSNMVKAKVELYDGSTLAAECTCGGYLSDFTVSREGEHGKFFGFGVCHKLDMVLIDLYKTLRVYEGFTAKICLGDGEIFDCPYPDLEITSVSVDKKSGDIKITAYDPLHKASKLTYKDLGITAPYTLRQLTEACARLLGLSVIGLDSAFNLNYIDGDNFERDESEILRSILNQIAEVTQTIYYINNNNQLVFKRLSTDSVATYDETKYYEFETAEPKTLKSIGNATELGENLLAENNDIETGVAQYIRENRLLELRDDIPTILEDAVNRVSGLTLYQFELDWSGDYLLEIGDCIAITYENDATLLYILNDVISYAGTLSEQTSWQYKEDDTETFSNPTNIGDKINQTFAKVNKLEKKITLYVGEVVEKELDNFNESITEVEEKVTQLELTTDGIKASVENLSTDIVTKTYVDEQILSAAGAAKDYTDAEVTETTTLINEKVAEIKATTDSITQRVVNEESKTVEFDSALNSLDSKVSTNTEQIGELEVSSDGISASVSSLSQNTSESFDSLHADITALSKRVDASITNEDVTIAIKSELENGIDKITTSTGYTFDADGLHISKSTSSMESTLNEDGLVVSRYDTPVLTAQSDGVNALNISVRQYFKIGGSRFEVMSDSRVGCFWVGV